MLIAGCKKKEIKKVSATGGVQQQCLSLPPCLIGKYIPDQGSSDTVYIEFNKNLCPSSIYNEYVVKEYDSVINKKAVDPIPWKDFFIISTKEDQREVFAKGDKLVVSLYYENDYPVISTVYDNRVSKRFTKVQ